MKRISVLVGGFSLVVLAVVLLVSCPRQTGMNPTVLLISIDAIRWEDVALADTPNLDDHKPVPSQYQLHAPYPNPFNMATNLSYELPQQTAVSLAVYNLQGEAITRLVNQVQPAGTYHVQWNGTDDTDRLMSSGIYLVRFATPIYTRTVKTVLLK